MSVPNAACCVVFQRLPPSRALSQGSLVFRFRIRVRYLVSQRVLRSEHYSKRPPLCSYALPHPPPCSSTPLAAAFPLSLATTYTGSVSTTTWDEEKGYACMCDSAWAVGLGSGERQASEWFGHDCSKRRCPSNDDPMTTDPDYTDTSDNNGVETDCQNRYDNGASIQPSIWAITSVVSGKGYVFISGATTDSLCQAANSAVVALNTPTFTQAISTTGAYGLCKNTAGNNAANYVAVSWCVVVGRKRRLPGVKLTSDTELCVALPLSVLSM